MTRARMDAEQTEENKKILNRMLSHSDFLRNPRYLPVASEKGMIEPSVSLLHRIEFRWSYFGFFFLNQRLFVVDPEVVEFPEYELGGLYEVSVSVKNNSAISRRLRFLPPRSQYFAIASVVYPHNIKQTANGTTAQSIDNDESGHRETSGLVAPGMGVTLKVLLLSSLLFSGLRTTLSSLFSTFQVHFSPDSLGAYEDFVTVQTDLEANLAAHPSSSISASSAQSPTVMPFLIHLHACRNPPSLTLPAELSCGCCSVKDQAIITFHCKNTGGPGFFKLSPAHIPAPSDSSSDAVWFCFTFWHLLALLFFSPSFPRILAK